MKNRELNQETLCAYMKDFKAHLESLNYIDTSITNDMFWAYVAGREHGKEIYPAVVPVKARWEECRHEVYRNTGKCRLCAKQIQKGLNL